MAAEPQKTAATRSYPVWVGNLKETVRNKDIYDCFCPFGNLTSCAVMQDEHGKSKGFGYANFQSKSAAEAAAQGLNGFIISGQRIRTKGPSMLKQEGHISLKLRPNSPDFRPYTDCSFFIEGAKCKRKSCPYRHSNEARKSSSVCLEWLEKRCLNVGCPYRHPGGKEAKNQAQMVKADPSLYLKCEGKCGDRKCGALFVSTEDLQKHVDAGTRAMSQCRQCRAIFPSRAEYQDHLGACYASTSTTSSSDVEMLSDTDTDEYIDGEDPVGDVLPRPKPLVTSLRGKGKQKMSPVSLTKLLNGESQRPVVSGGHGDASYHGQYYEGVELESSSIGYLSAYSDNESDSDPDEAVEYTQGEIARLLSLNEQDMVNSDSEEEEGGGAGEKRGVVRSFTKQGGPVGGVSPETNKQTTPTHKIRMEPVGVFWDIENCPVPVNKSAFCVADKMRREFISGKREAEFMCVCDITKERKEVTDELHKAQVTLVHVNAIAKNAADDKLRHSLRRFAHTYPSPATVVLISGDVNFSMELNDLMNVHNLTVVLVHNSVAADALKVFANRLVGYEEFIKDVEPPSQHQRTSNQSRIVVVTGLPANMAVPRISARLDRLSDNCGGKVLNVDKRTGRARVLFRTHEYATKALKRMKGEDVFGSKVDTYMEDPPPQQQNQTLVGANLAKSFPPVVPTPQRAMGFMSRTPPLLHCPPGPSYRPPPPPPPLMPHPHGPYRAPPPPPHSHQYPPLPQGGPNSTPPLMPPHPLMPPRQPSMVPTPSILPPAPISLLRFSNPPISIPQHLPKGSIPRPEGRILIFKIPPHEEPGLLENVVRLQSHAFLSTQIMILWHSYSELQVVLKLDFLQTTAIMKEELVRSLYEKGELKPELASKFVETCTKSVLNVLSRHKIQWEVTTCGWSSEEEENRIIRSNVIAMLHRNPTCWTKFSNFKKRYSEMYASAISEMTIHSACGGAVQILSDQGSTQTQIIIFYEFSPLVKIVNNPKLHVELKAAFQTLLSMQPDKKIKLLDFVTTFNSHKLCPLPTSSSGKMLQEIISSMPNVTLIGNKPSNIFVTLDEEPAGTAPPAESRASVPNNLAGISAAFCEIVKKRGGKNGIPYKIFQKEYQSFYHRSFRVSDFLPGDNMSVRDLINACQGVKLVLTELPNGTVDERVCLDQPLFSPPTTAEKVTSANVGNGRTPTKATSDPKLTAPREFKGLVRAFHQLLHVQGKDGIPLKRFQQEYQTFFHHSFKVSDYLPPGDVGVRELVKACPGMKIVFVDLPNGKKEERVFLTSATPNIQPPSAPSATHGRRESSPTPTSILPGPTPERSSSDTKLVDGSGSSSVEPKRPFEEIAVDFRSLLQQSDAKQIPLKNIQQEYQTLFHHSFKVSSYLSGDARLKHLLLNCQGIKVVSVQGTGGKSEDVVCLDDTSKSWASETTSEAGPSSNLPTDAIMRFKLDCIEVLSTMEERSLLMKQFPEYFMKVKREQFLLANYKAKKIVQLVEAIPDVVQLLNVNNERTLKLCPNVGSKKSCEWEMEVLIYEQPGHRITLDRFMKAYEDKYSHRLSHFHGHPKLLKLLEDFPETIEITGGGPSRRLALTKTRLFACEMTELLLSSAHTHMPISKIRPLYEVRFGKTFIATEYGHAKLIKLLEAIPDVINIFGSGASRTVTLKNNPLYTSLFRVTSGSGHTSPSTSVPTSPVHLSHLTDEVTAILMTTHSQKMSLIELTKGYNQAFRSQGPKIGSSDLIQAIHKLSNFKVTGTGPTCYLQIAPESSKVSPRKSSPKPQQVSPKGKVAKSTTSVPAAAGCGGSGDETDPYHGMPELVDEPVVRKRLFDQLSTSDSSVVQPSGSGVSTVSPLPEGEAKRLSSETRRLLLCHQEHAMTLTELTEHFVAEGDPATPTAELLYQVLVKHGGTNNTGDSKKFEISYFPTDVGTSLVQLNRTDCLWKLGEDLLQLFVFHPTADLSLLLDTLEALYAECFSRKLQTAVYSAKDIHQVLRAKQMKKVIQVEADKCSPCSPHKQQVLASLLTELLFIRGAECSSLDSLPRLYQDHFRVPLLPSCFEAEDLASLLQLPKVGDAISLVNISGNVSRPVLKQSALFAEQLRRLLTMQNGHIALDQLEATYTAEFGGPSSPEIQTYIKKKLPHSSFHVVNLASHKWAVWSPTGHPYCQHRWREIPSSQPCPSLTAADSMPVVSVDPSTSRGRVNSSGSFVNDLIDLSDLSDLPQAEGASVSKSDTMLDVGGERGGLNAFPSGSTYASVMENSKDHDKGDLIDLSDVPVENLTEKEGEVEHLSEAPAKENLLDVSDTHSLDSVSTSPLDAPAQLSHASSSECLDQALVESPYDFLKAHPDLIAELSKTGSELPEDDLTVLTEVLTLQRLQELGIGMPASGSRGLDHQMQTRSGDAPSQEVPVLPEGNGPVDFLKLGWKPNQVLAELQRQKTRYQGGILPPDQMEPFLDYFGEMSSRELERMESQEGKPKPKKGGRKRRNMAIRFPDQSQGATPIEPHHMFSVSVPREKLPVADFGESSEDSEGSPPVPLDRDRYIRELLKGKSSSFVNADELLRILQPNEKDSDTSETGGSTSWPSLSQERL